MQLMISKVSNICFYRYEAIEYASTNIDGEYTSYKIPNPKVVLRTYNVLRETPKGHWIEYGLPSSKGKWVSKTSKKRYAYPTKIEALDNFIKRTEWRVAILKYQLWSCEISVNLAKFMLLD